LNNTYIVYVIFSEHKSSYFSVLKKFAPRSNIIVVNNNRRNYEKYNEFLLLKGDNKNREFGAYYQGYQLIKSKLTNDDIVIFCNDTFMSRRFFLGYFYLAFLFFSYYLPFFKKNQFYICGEVHKLDEKIIRTNNINLKNHISTYFFITNKKTANLFISSFNSKLKISLSVDNSTFISYKLDGGYLNRLNKWLLYPGNGWYNAQKPNRKNRLFLAKKALSIFIEHKLALICFKRDIRIIPIYSSKRYSLSRLLLYLFNFYDKNFN